MVNDLHSRNSYIAQCAVKNLILKYEVNMDKKNTVTQEQIDALVNEGTMTVLNLDSKTTMVKLDLKNGWTMVETSSCVDPKNYDAELGKSICIERIKNKLWELEGYRLQWKLFDEHVLNKILQTR